MTSTFRFVHCSDLHLDTPFTGIGATDDKTAEVLADSTFRSFRRVIETAILEKAEFVLVAGDVYDSEKHSLRARLEFRNAVRQAAKNGIEVFMVHGNHDPLSSWKEDISFPDNFHRFGSDLESLDVKRGGNVIARVSGISYPVSEVWENLALRFRKVPEKPSVFTAGLLHCNLGSVSSKHRNYSPCTIEDLERVPVDYWALGHVHGSNVIRDSDPAIVYPGNIQGRHVGESGMKGCYIVDVVEGNVKRISFRETSSVLWHNLRIDVTDMKGPAEAVDLMRERCLSLAGNIPSLQHVARFTLCGSPSEEGVFFDLVDGEEIAEILRSMDEGSPCRVLIESVNTEMMEMKGTKRLSGDENFTAEFLKAIEPLRKDPDILRKILPELEGYRKALPFLDIGDRETLMEMITKAEEEGLARLLGRNGK